MELNSYQEDGIVRLEVIGRLDTATAQEFEKKVLAVIENAEQSFIMDCDGMEYISSSGLRIMLMMLKKIKNAQGNLVLYRLQDNVSEVFRICNFTSLFNITATKEAAIELCSAG